MKEPNGVAGRAVRSARLDRGLSSSALGAASGMSKSAVSAIENGRSNPTVETLQKIASGLGGELRIEIALPRRRRAARRRTTTHIALPSDADTANAA